ncbi:MAG TPA: DNA polymerase III subunit beta [Nitrospinae bacterium]|nr:DNA polymerase III subunit beta [Nitrospinota bacterium]
MEFTITKSEFFKGLQKSQGVADTKGAIPILSNILIEVVDSGIWIYATDLNIGIKGFYNASVKSKGRFTANARKLFDIVRELPDADINVNQKSGVKRKEHENEFADLWINLSCGNYKTRLSGLPVDEFPAFPSYGEDYLVKFEPSQLKDMVRKTIFSVSSDETRYTLNGTLLEAEGNTVKLVSTDGHRLSYIKNENPKIVEKKINVIIPQKTTSELLKLVEDDNEDVLFSIYENHAVFKKKKFVLVSRVIDGQFPNYEVVLPKNNDKRVILNKDVLIHALKRVSLLSDEKSKMVKFNIEKDNIELLSDTAGIGEAKEKVDVKYKGEGLSIGLNARYILDIMSAVDSNEIILDIKDSVSPTLFMQMNDENYKCVIMPMRLQ